MRKANSFHKMAFSMKMSYFLHTFCLSLLLQSHLVITHRGSFILYLMPYTLRHRMTKPTKWSMSPTKSQISLGMRPVWSASSLCERPNIYWCGQRRHWSDLEYSQADLSLRWVHMQYCWFCHVAAHFRSNYCQTPNIPLQSDNFSVVKYDLRVVR